MSQKRNRHVYLTGHSKLDSSWRSIIPEEGPFNLSVGRLITHYNEQYVVAIIPGNRLPDLFKGEAIRSKMQELENIFFFKYCAGGGNASNHEKGESNKIVYACIRGPEDHRQKTGTWRRKNIKIQTQDSLKCGYKFEIKVR